VITTLPRCQGIFFVYLKQNFLGGGGWGMPFLTINHTNNAFYFLGDQISRLFTYWAILNFGRVCLSFKK
jgi:hypothetical protein